MKTTFGTQTIEISPLGDDYVAVMDGKRILVEIVRVDAGQGRMDLRFTELSESIPSRNRSVSDYVSSDMAKRWVTINGTRSCSRKHRAQNKASDTIMPGD
ncbi:hypothetical protein [Candidatus Villigracilis affinis]|uniref:hypothetical protein n=1 Tax=Candidatus Villigracilis affinis TaxID=3140682 RepID=UPI001D86F8C4|nr:hypothetical protein [Anaerolineales bacterium]